MNLRTCASPGCTTVLRRGNPGPRCQRHKLFAERTLSRKEEREAAQDFAELFDAERWDDESDLYPRAGAAHG